MKLKKFFQRIKFFIRKLLASSEVQAVVNFVGIIREIVENPATADLAALTPSEKDDNTLQDIKQAFTHVDTYKETTKAAKDKEGIEEIAYFIDRIRKTKKGQRGAIYLALASEILRNIDSNVSRSEADTLVQLQVSQNKIRG